MSLSAGEETFLGRSSRRKKLAGYLRAANELRQSYQQSYQNSNDVREAEDTEASETELGIPGAFPGLKVARNKNEEMVMFPSYAKRHLRKSRASHVDPTSLNSRDTAAAGDLDYWRKEWDIYEDANAVVDVDVRGWIYSPHKGPMTRKNRLLLGIARHLSGIPAPSTGPQVVNKYRERVNRSEEDLAAKQAQEITRIGEQEADVAGRGGYSEGPGKNSDREAASSSGNPSRAASPKPGDFPHPVTNTSLQSEPPGPGGLSKRSSWNQPADMSPEELAIANSHLLRRLKPFLTNPSVNMPLTIFYYNDETSQSRTTTTNDSGHFNFRASLNFAPTHVRVLASESLSATTDIKITEPRGVSLISDIDDTIKHSAIGGGAKEIFRNAFIRELGDLTIEGVREWYNKMSDMDVKLHYLSNSPWQMYPLLVSYFTHVGLPAGSFHLKQYSGMLQGIFEPVAERKKGTLERILNDFPDRRFILVGDSGEADLELYTETALAHPKKILGIFIRDVSTSPSKGFFDPSGITAGSDPKPTQSSQATFAGNARSYSTQTRPTLSPRSITTSGPITAEPEMEDLIEFSDDDGETQSRPPLPTTKSHVSTNSTGDLASTSRRHPPPRPAKPVALRSSSSESFKTISKHTDTMSRYQRSPPKPPRKPQDLQGSFNATSGERQGYRTSVKNKVASAYNALPSAVSYWNGTPQNHHSGLPSRSSTYRGPTDSSATTDRTPRQAPPIPPRRNLSSYPVAAAHYATNRIWNGTGGDGQSNGSTNPASKREELWRRRLARARESLEGKGVLLKVWRVGDDVVREAMRLVEENQQGKKER